MTPIERYALVSNMELEAAVYTRTAPGDTLGPVVGCLECGHHIAVPASDEWREYGLITVAEILQTLRDHGYSSHPAPHL